MDEECVQVEFLWVREGQKQQLETACSRAVASQMQGRGAVTTHWEGQPVTHAHTNGGNRDSEREKLDHSVTEDAET